MDLAFGSIENVAAMARDRLIIIEWIARMMRECDQIDSGGVGFYLYVVVSVECGGQSLHNRSTRSIANMKYPSTRVGGFPAPKRLASLRVIKHNAGGLL